MDAPGHYPPMIRRRTDKEGFALCCVKRQNICRTGDQTMFVVRNRFVAKPSCAGKLAAQLKEAVTSFEMPNARVLTDVTGDFNQVVMEFTNNLGEIEKRMQETMGSPKYREKMAGYTELWITGSREILRIA
jgi:hypothetical protein